MKKALLLSMAFMVAVMWSAPGFSADKYVSGSIGIVWMDDIEFEDHDSDDSGEGFELGTDSGITLLGAYGCDYGDYRLEAELGYQKNDIASWADVSSNDEREDLDEDGDVSVLSLMLNGAYDIDLGNDVEVYPYAGVGVAHITFEDAPLCFEGSSFRNKDVFSLAYQVGVGIAIPVSENIQLDARYRYFVAEGFSMDKPAANGDLSSHSALLGLRVGI
ncbi:outer membrane beta-barrel protein [Prosthecochloris sp.]|uniref:outer membrane protein n=1 Tax=Prosthecochloris sp. TaxID=290513 RepID=UPI0025FEB5DB|nr:outer membrane beta-barrel protein [Prosthecochloris sp.]